MAHRQVSDHYYQNRVINNSIPLEFPMKQDPAVENLEYECQGTRVIIVYPEKTLEDEVNIKEIKAIMFAALKNQMTS